eukprot:comp18223_c0_seq1/m.32190 comp18223_c0_seq1/g.32190  ORF comp18223_c0_seq1/g.32190 comp18223_c0_seq1/m.32190 type:complete len:316 (-) comp18223_c0_seq1:59-1006(-)
MSGRHTNFASARRPQDYGGKNRWYAPGSSGDKVSAIFWVWVNGAWFMGSQTSFSAFELAPKLDPFRGSTKDHESMLQACLRKVFEETCGLIHLEPSPQELLNWEALSESRLMHFVLQMTTEDLKRLLQDFEQNRINPKTAKDILGLHFESTQSLASSTRSDDLPPLSKQMKDIVSNNREPPSTAVQIKLSRSEEDIVSIYGVQYRNIIVYTGTESTRTVQQSRGAAAERVLRSPGIEDMENRKFIILRLRFAVKLLRKFGREPKELANVRSKLATFSRREKSSEHRELYEEFLDALDAWEEDGSPMNEFEFDFDD